MQADILFHIPGANYRDTSSQQGLVRVQATAGAVLPETDTRPKFYSGIYSTILLIHIPDP
ncbi:hypothetical protein [Desulfonatronospira sp.]|uniref:hypothetical protein n=1 Tax=Desulfonatronospira sp. TaxID=1962951 RepID=UPI0025C64E2E|nr:hypothetical protein [Desulfonatronospira sp.]